MTTASTPHPRGPAADPRYLKCIHTSNPYNFSDALLAASRLPPKVTDKHVFFLGHEGDESEVCFSQWFPAPFKAAQHPFEFDEAGKVTEFDYQRGGKVEFPTAEHAM
ncbi:hypothetical protein LTR66_015638, partial [Elasticomyces elasticus]